MERLGFQKLGILYPRLICAVPNSVFVLFIDSSVGLGLEGQVFVFDILIFQILLVLHVC